MGARIPIPRVLDERSMAHFLNALALEVENEVDAAAAQTSADAAQTDATAAQGDIDTHEALTSAHGVTGDIMGTGGVQTVTGAKTFADTKLLLRNAADTFNGSFTNTNTADRIYTLPDAAGTIALTGGAPAAHAVSHTDGSDDIQSATAAQKGLATAAQITKLDAIEALADVTDAANVATALGSVSVAAHSDVVSATNTNRFVLVANGSTGYVGRFLLEADISDLQAYAVAGGAFHDGFSDFVADEHIDWTSASDNFSTSGTLTVSGVGPHSVGGAINSKNQLTITGTFTPGSGTGSGLFLDTQINALAGTSAFGTRFKCSLAEASSGTHPHFATLQVHAPNIIPGGAVVTTASSIRIVAAPTEGVNNYALLVDEGAVRFDGSFELFGAMTGGGSGHDQFSDFASNEHYLQSAITVVGTVITGNVDAVVSAASLTVAGKIEVATVTETNTGTDATRAVSPDGLDGWTGSGQITTVGTLAGGDATGVVDAATDAAQGKVELATDAETVTGTDTARAITPANATAKMAAPGEIGGTTPAAGTFTDIIGNSNHAMEGYSTGRNVTRSIVLALVPGATPETNISIVDISGSGQGFNEPTITDGADIAKSGSNGSFALNAAGTVLTLDLTEVVVGVQGSGLQMHDLNNSSTTDMYIPVVSFSGGNIIISYRKRGTTALTDLTTILKAGDRTDLQIAFITSS